MKDREEFEKWKTNNNDKLKFNEFTRDNLIWLLELAWQAAKDGKSATLVEPGQIKKYESLRREYKLLSNSYDVVCIADSKQDATILQLQAEIKFLNEGMSVMQKLYIEALGKD